MVEVLASEPMNLIWRTGLLPAVTIISVPEEVGESGSEEIYGPSTEQ